MPYQPIGKYGGSRGFARKTDFKRPVTFYDRVRFVGSDSTMEIFGGTLDGTDITAGTITTNKLVIGSGDNMVQDPKFRNASAWMMENDGGGSWTFGAPGTYGSEVDFAPPITSSANISGPDVACHVGDVFYAEVYVWLGGSTAGTARLKVLEFDGDEVYNLRFSEDTVLLSASSGWVQLSLEHTIVENDTESIRFQVYVDSGATIGTHVAFSRGLLRRKAGTIIIEDQAIDIARMLDPVFVDTGGGITVVDWTTTMAVKHTESITVPSWVGTINIYAHAAGTKVWVTGQWVEPQLVVGAAIVGTGRTQRVVNHVGAVYAHGHSVITTPGSSVNMQVKGQVLTTTEVNVASIVKWTATGTR